MTSGRRWWWRPTASTTSASRPRSPPTGADRCRCSAALGVPADRPLVVFVGTLEPRKGVAPLVAAFDRARRGPPRRRVGPRPASPAGAWPRRSGRWRRPGTGDRIVRTGYLPDEAVPALLRQAAVVAYPALEEGFGLPALEALACGAPLVTTEGTAMAELGRGRGAARAPGRRAAAGRRTRQCPRRGPRRPSGGRTA